MQYWYVSQAAHNWGVSERWVQRLLQEGRVPGATRQGRRWLIPAGTPRPVDARQYRYVNVPESLREGFTTVDALKDELSRHRPLTQDELDRLHTEFTIEYTYDSNAIEGSTLTLRETALIFEGLAIAEKPLKEHLEVIGHRDAYEFVVDIAARRPPEAITARIIREIHFLVLIDRPTARGTYRTIPVRILGTSHKPPDPLLVPELIDQLLDSTANDRRHPIEKAALFHLEFESIHPFVDGNGRTGRLLLNFMLLQAGYLPINIKYADRQRYYDCFQAWDNHHDHHPMTTLITNYAEQRFRDWLVILNAC